MPSRWPDWGQGLLAFGLGALSVLAFAPFNLGLVGLLTLTLLLHLWQGAQTPGQTFRLGYFFGLGLMGFGVFWLHVSIEQFGGLTPAAAVFLALLFAAFIALFFGLSGWLYGRLANRDRPLSSLLLLAPASWLLLEWLRGWFLGGFPWLSMGYSQIDLPLSGYAPLLGVYGVSLLLLLSAGLLNLWPRLWAPVALLVLWAAGSGLGLVEWTRPVGEPLQVSLLQGNIAQEDKWKRSMLRPTLMLYQRMTDEAVGSKLVIWPETAIPAYASRVEQPLLQPLHERMQTLNADLLTGLPVRDATGAYYNAMVNIGSSGRQQYRKRHLVPFGEYMPFDSLLRPLTDYLQIPMSDFSAGQKSRPLLTLAGYPAGISICYEDAFGEEVVQALPEAAFLVNASNDAWFGDSLAPDQHLQIARMRSLESGRYLLRATNTGVSAIIDQRGGLRRVAPLFEQATLTDHVQPFAGSTPYALWGNSLVVVLGLLMLLATRLLQGSGRAGTHSRD